MSLSCYKLVFKKMTESDEDINVIFSNIDELINEQKRALKDERDQFNTNFIIKFVVFMFYYNMFSILIDPEHNLAKFIFSKI